MKDEILILCWVWYSYFHLIKLIAHHLMTWIIGWGRSRYTMLQICSAFSPYLTFSLARGTAPPLEIITKRCDCWWGFLDSSLNRATRLMLYYDTRIGKLEFSKLLKTTDRGYSDFILWYMSAPDYADANGKMNKLVSDYRRHKSTRFRFQRRRLTFILIYKSRHRMLLHFIMISL